MRKYKEYQDALDRLTNRDYLNEDGLCEIDDLDSDINLLQELVNKQIPIKPNKIILIKGLLGRFECPICGCQIRFIQGDNEPNEMDNFCGKCGQAIDGNDE